MKCKNILNFTTNYTQSQTWSAEPAWHWGVCQWKNLLQNGSFHCLRMNLLKNDSILWTRRQTYRQISLILLVWLVMDYLFMTQSHHNITSLWCPFAYANVIVLVILRRASRYSCLDWLFWILHYLCKNYRVTSHPFVWIYLITTKSRVLSTQPIRRFRVNLCTTLNSRLLAGLILRQVYQWASF
jgi:hypothetical protein